MLEAQLRDAEIVMGTGKILRAKGDAAIEIAVARRETLEDGSELISPAELGAEVLRPAGAPRLDLFPGRGGRAAIFGQAGLAETVGIALACAGKEVPTRLHLAGEQIARQRGGIGFRPGAGRPMDLAGPFEGAADIAIRIVPGLQGLTEAREQIV